MGDWSYAEISWKNSHPTPMTVIKETLINLISWKPACLPIPSEWRRYKCMSFVSSFLIVWNSFYISESHKIAIIKKKTSQILWESNNVAHLRCTGGCRWIQMQGVTNISSLEPGPGEACPKENGSARHKCPKCKLWDLNSQWKRKSHHQAGGESCHPALTSFPRQEFTGETQLSLPSY